MEAEKNIFSIRGFRDDWDNPEATVKVKNNMKFGKGIGPANKSIS